MTNLVETWHDLKGWENSYQISAFGRVRSKDRKQLHRGFLLNKKGRILKEWYDTGGYPKVSLNEYPRKADYKIHKLMEAQFLPEPKKGQIIDHIDFNKKNNRIDNLQQITQGENIQRCRDFGLTLQTGGTHSKARKIICNDTGNIYQTIKEAAAAKNIPIPTLSGYLNGRHPNKTNLAFFS